MARTGKKTKEPTDGDEAGGALSSPGATGGKSTKADIPPTFKVWFEDAWHGWLKPVGAIVLILGAYVAYDRGLLPEARAGLVVVTLIIGGTIAMAALPVFDELQSRPHKLMLGLFVAVWALAAGYPSLRRAFPTKGLGEPVAIATCNRWKEADHRECADPKLAATATLPDANTAYEVEVSGQLKGFGDTSSNYHLIFTGDGGQKDEIDGTLSRSSWHQRTSRRGTGGTTIRQERNEETHRLENVRGTSVKIEADGIDDALENGLQIAFTTAGPSPIVFWILSGLCILIGLVLDYRFSLPKARTYFTMAAGVTAVFSYFYPTEATPHFLVRPAIAEVVRAFATGGLAGWLLSVIVNSFKPQPKKLVR